MNTESFSYADSSLVSVGLAIIYVIGFILLGNHWRGGK